MVSSSSTLVNHGGDNKALKHGINGGTKYSTKHSGGALPQNGNFLTVWSVDGKNITLIFKWLWRIGDQTNEDWKEIVTKIH